MRRYECPVCGALVDDDVWEYHRVQEDRIIDVIKEHYPWWVRKDGSCPKAIEFYRSLVLKDPAGTQA